jgi:hypothetical protein
VFEYSADVHNHADVQPSPPTVVTVESNSGGDLLLSAVRDALAHLPVRVVPITRTGRTAP